MRMKATHAKTGGDACCLAHPWALTQTTRSVQLRSHLCSAGRSSRMSKCARACALARACSWVAALGENEADFRKPHSGDAAGRALLLPVGQDLHTLSHASCTMMVHANTHDCAPENAVLCCGNQWGNSQAAEPHTLSTCRTSNAISRHGTWRCCSVTCMHA
jgi:hypothetical protein